MTTNFFAATFIPQMLKKSFISWNTKWDTTRERHTTPLSFFFAFCWAEWGRMQAISHHHNMCQKLLLTKVPVFLFAWLFWILKSSSNLVFCLQLKIEHLFTCHHLSKISCLCNATASRPIFAHQAYKRWRKQCKLWVN